MEEQQNTPQHMPPQQEVSFPSPKEPSGKGKGIKIVIAVIGVIVIVAAGGWFILGNSAGGSGSPSPTPVGGLSSFPTPESTSTPEPSATATPEPIEKSEVRIEVLNGTGVPGEASFLQSALEDAGFEEITAANADSQDETKTTATYSRDLPADVADEITALLEDLYEDVSTRKATISGDFDVSITTGPRTDASTSSDEKEESSPSPSASPTASPEPEE